MGQMDILNIFFENPSKNFHIRGIAKILNSPKTTVSYHTNNLVKRGLLIKEKKNVFPSYRANETNELFIFYKKMEFIKRLIETNLLDYIEMECNPKCMVLFGSFAKGEYDTNSDIDLFVQASETTLALDKFEKKFKHKINIFFEPKIENLSPELLNNIINGIKIRGILKVK